MTTRRLIIMLIAGMFASLLAVLTADSFGYDTNTQSFIALIVAFETFLLIANYYGEHPEPGTIDAAFNEIAGPTGNLSPSKADLRPHLSGGWNERRGEKTLVTAFTLAGHKVEAFKQEYAGRGPDKQPETAWRIEIEKPDDGVDIESSMVKVEGNKVVILFEESREQHLQ